MSATLCGNDPFLGKSLNGEAGEPRCDNDNGRDERGRFTAGNIGGPGNPFARRVARFRKVLHQCASVEDMKEIGRQLVAMAKTGDLAAIKLLLQYQVGRPVAVVDPDGLDLQEMALFLRGPRPDQIHALTSGQHLPPDAWMGMLRVCLPLIAKQFHDVFLKVFERTDAAQAAGEARDSDTIVEDAIDEVLGRTSKEQVIPPPDRSDDQPVQATANGDEKVDASPCAMATEPLANGYFQEFTRRQCATGKGDEEGQGTLPSGFEQCPLCRR
jgi:hypothetical protein